MGSARQGAVGVRGWRPGSRRGLPRLGTQEGAGQVLGGTGAGIAHGGSSDAVPGQGGLADAEDVEQPGGILQQGGRRVVQAAVVPVLQLDTRREGSGRVRQARAPRTVADLADARSVLRHAARLLSGAQLAVLLDPAAGATVTAAYVHAFTATT